VALSRGIFDRRAVRLVCGVARRQRGQRRGSNSLSLQQYSASHKRSVTSTVALKPTITTAVHTFLNFSITKVGRVLAKHIESNIMKRKIFLRALS